jgi:hypothetical protein
MHLFSLPSHMIDHRSSSRAVRCSAIALGALVPLAASSWACSSCGCNLSPDWVTPGLAAGAGFTLDLRYDQLNQNQLRHGTHAISAADASQIVTPDGEMQEVERYTRNHYLTLGLDYSPQPDWGVNLQLPYIMRSHSSLGTASDGSTAGADGGQYDSKTWSLGDVKLIGRYLGLLSRRNLALSAGLKLPSGSPSKTGTSTDSANPGPVNIDRGLQPGSGSTDAIVGVSYADALNRDWDYLVQGLFQSALSTRDGYRPGNGINLNLGLRYAASSSVQPQLQINVRHASRDIGPNADTVNSGGTLVYLSPGFNAPLGQQTALYGYVQLPIHQNVYGVQLTPHVTASIGVRHTF